MELTEHPVAAIFPLMTGDEFDSLRLDIKEYGQHEPIWLHEGQIIDGRNRYRACRALGLEPVTREWDGEGSLVAFVMSQNLHRRHLNASQRALIAQDALPHLEAEAKERQRAHGGTAPGRRNTPSINGVSVPRSAAEDAAALVGVSSSYVHMAKNLMRDQPESVEAVRRGEMSLSSAKREVQPALPDGRPRVLKTVGRWRCPVCDGKGYVTHDPGFESARA